jgi:polyisoprenoid-binding protein YceI
MPAYDLLTQSGTLIDPGQGATGLTINGVIPELADIRFAQVDGAVLVAGEKRGLIRIEKGQEVTMPRVTFFLDDPVGRNTVRVMSRAPLETILVHSTDITGEVELDTDDIRDRPRLSLSVPVDSLDTGIPLMNEVMRSDRWLHAAKYPRIVFTLEKITSPATPAPLRDGVPIAVDADGTFELRGVSKACPVHAEVTWLPANERTARRLPGDLLHLRAQCDLQLKDFGIESHLSPQSMDKVAGTLDVTIDVFLSSQRPAVPEKMLQDLARARRELAERLLRA